MSVPSVVLQPTPVPKPSLPPGWSCHVSKSTGMNYYFNRFTGAKTWELSDILPGHSSVPADDASPGTLDQPITVRDSHHQQGQNTG